MSDVALRRLLSLVLVLATTSSIAVDAFLSLPQYQTRPGSSSHSCRSPSSLDIFGRGSKRAQTEEDDGTNGNADSLYSKRKNGGIVRKKVKKLNWLSPPSSSSSRNDASEDRHAWKDKNKKVKPGSLTYRWRGLRQKIRGIIYRNTVYVLECEHDKYYIGSTRNRKQRYRQHFENPKGGSKWTKMHKPIRVVAEFNRIPTRYLMGMESQKTAEYMMKYGVNNVRGAAYCVSREFTTRDISDLTGFLGHYNQLDYRELHSELWKVLPRPEPSASSFPPPVRKFRKYYKPKRNENHESNGNNGTPGNAIKNDDENPKAIARRKLKNYKRRQRKKNNASKKDQAKYYKCGQVGHWARDCPNDGTIGNNQTIFSNRIEIPAATNGEATSFEETLDKLFEPDPVPPSSTPET